MNYKQRAALMIILIAALCGLAIWGVARLRYRGLSTTAEWLERLPTRDAIVAYIDFAALRQAGLLQMLAGSKMAEEPEYKVFVLKTDFDYTRDLDAVLACFTPKAKEFIVRGRFDWSSLQSYTRDQNGACINSLCRMNGSTPERKISFFPLRPNLMGLAVSPDDSAAVELQAFSVSHRKLTVPDAPAWISLPPAVLKSDASLPENTRMFARALANADDVNIAIAPRGNRFEARLQVACRSAQDATAVTAQLGQITASFRETISREKQTPNPRDLSGVLSAGAFSHTGAQAVGVWPLERGFLEALLGGS